AHPTPDPKSPITRLPRACFRSRRPSSTTGGPGRPEPKCALEWLTRSRKSRITAGCTPLSRCSHRWSKNCPSATRRKDSQNYFRKPPEELNQCPQFAGKATTNLTERHCH